MAKKLEYKIVKETIEKYNYILNTSEDEWEMLATRFPISITCPNNHTNLQRYNAFQRGNRCKICSNNIQKSFVKRAEW